MKNFSNTAQECYFNINVLLNKYEQSEGCSIDYYHDISINHSMADAKFISSISTLYEIGKITLQQYKKLLTPIIDRLTSNCIKIAPDKIAFGLGFPHNNLPKDEPYLITSSIVLQSLYSTPNIVQKEQKVHELINNGLQGLKKIFFGTMLANNNSIKMPTYSPKLNCFIYNAAAYGASVLIQSGRINNREIVLANKVISSVLNSFQEDIGWQYSKSNNIVDLIHQCYIVNALFNMTHEALANSKYVLSIFSTFSPHGEVYDRSKLYKEPELKEILNKKVIGIRKIGNNYLINDNKNARLWSISEFLLLTCNAAIYHKSDKSKFLFYHSLAHDLYQKVVDIINSQNIENKYLRHTMHALDALCKYLKLLKIKSTVK